MELPSPTDGTRRAVSVACVVALASVLVATPVAASQTDGADVQPISDDLPEEACGVVENLTVDGLTGSMAVEDGSVLGLERNGEVTNASISNGSVLFDRATITVDRAVITEDRLSPGAGMVTVAGGDFFLQNASATVEGEQVALSSERRSTADVAADEDDGVTVSGVEQISQSPASLLENSSMDTLALADLPGGLTVDHATRDVMGVVQLSMDEVQLEASPLQPTFTDVTVEDGELNATNVAVPVDDGDLSIGELAVTAGTVTTRTSNAESAPQDQTVELDDVELDGRSLVELFDQAC